MESGYRVIWTDHALIELEETFKYLESNFGERELKKLATELNKFLSLIVQNPSLFPKSDIAGIHRAVLLKFNTIYYRQKGEFIQIVSFFSNRQNPSKAKL